MKAPFFKRLLAYVIDIIIITTLVTLICSALPTKTDTVEEELKELSTALIEKEVTPNEYISEYKDLMYKSNKNEKISLTINLVLTIAYFVIFQYMNKGQTLGKKLLSLKVVDKDNKKEISILKGLLRSILPLSILSNIIAVALLGILSKNTYMNLYLTVNELETIFVVVTLFLILYRKDGRGLHDMIANTMVITEKR